MKIKLLLVVALVATFLMLPFSILAEDNEVPSVEEVEEKNEEEVAEPSEEAQEPEEKPEEDKKENVLTVLVCDLSKNGELNKELSAKYELKSVLGVEAAVKYHVEKVLEEAGYTVAIDALGRPWITYEDLQVAIYAYPAKRSVQVIHYMTDCAGQVETQFMEWIEVPYLAELNDEEALKLAGSRIEQMSGRGYGFSKIKVEQVPDLPFGFTVLTEDGKEVEPQSDVPIIHLLYVSEGCPAETEPKPTTQVEEQVDSATVEVYQPGTTLPATGSKDVLAFFMSATALLGLGIFFAKKH